MYDASDRRHVRKAEKESKLADRQRAEVVTNIMSTSPGRAWILERLEGAQVFASVFRDSALAMAYAEGNRNQGLLLLADIMLHCPEQYILMMRERNERDLAREPKPEPEEELSDA